LSASRLLPPLVLLAILGAIVWRAAERPQREAIQKKIRARWEDPTWRKELVDEVARYLDRYHTHADRQFAAHALMRARDPGRAVRARWADLERTLPAGEVRAFAEDALIWLGWDDEPLRAPGEPAVPGTRPSPANIQCVMALLERDHAGAREWLEGRVRHEPIEEVYVTMRRSRGLQSTEARMVVARAARERAAAERARGLPTHDWDFITALLTPKNVPYPEREADLDLLIEVAKGTWRAQGLPRWNLACRVLGEAGDARAVAALHEVALLLTGSTAQKDQIDLAILRLCLLTAGDWSHDAEVRPLVASGSPEHAVVRTIYQEAVIHRWRSGDSQAVEPLTWLWDGLGATDPSVRERLGRGLLIEGGLPSAEVPVERLLEALEADGAPASLVVVAKAFRLRRGDPGARTALLQWLTGEGNEALTAGSWEAERALSPPISGLRALYLYD
jgi:hypothetical protein